MDTDVLVVGAGPVGLLMAAELLRHGVRCQIIDKKSGATTTSNALALHSRSLEIFYQLGLEENVEAKGVRITQVAQYAEKKLLSHVFLNRLNAPYPYALGIPQSETEHVLLAHLTKLGGQVQWDTELTQFIQENDGVQATLSNGVTISARYLIGADGYHSKVRELLRMTYEGHDLKQHFIMMDGEIDGDFNRHEIQVYFNKKGLSAFFHMKKFSRFVAEISHDPDYQTIKNPTRADFQRIAEERCPTPLMIHEPSWVSSFWVHERLATHYRTDRVFLMGDAAHAHSPAGGQGMNTGIQDAYNLAWKMAWLLKCKADQKLLASYEIERRPVAQGVLKMSTIMTHVASFKNPLLIALRNKLLPVILKRAATKMAYEISELTVNYRQSPLSQGKSSGKVKPGDRAPDGLINGERLFTLMRECQFVALDFSPESCHSRKSVFPSLTWIAIPLEATAFRQEYGMKTGVCLIRPDGYVGFIGDIAGLKRYLLGHY